jgi:phosphate-selective porin OprO/OprP
LALVLSPGGVRADEKELEELKARLERLEKQNEYLQRIIVGGGIQATDAGAAIGQNKAEVEKIVSDYLKAQEKAAKDAADKKAKEADAKGYEVGKDLNFKASWKDAPYFETGDKAFKVQLRGRWHNHWGWIDGDEATLNSIFNDGGNPNGESDLGDDGTIFRRSRIGVQGTIWEVFDFVAEWEFASGSAVWREMWMGVHELPYIGALRVGHYKEPFSIEQLTSSRFITFVERSIIDGPVDDNLAYNSGFNIYGTCCEESVGYSLFAGRHTNDQGVDVGDGDYNYTGRVWLVPVWEHNGRCAVHLGAAGSIRQPPGKLLFAGADRIRMRTRPYRIEPDEFLDVGGSAGFALEDYTVWNVEAAAVFGPLSIQAEYHNWNFNNVVSGADRIDLNYNGFYVFASYFLTGEKRDYSRTSGSFGRIKPYENFWVVKTGEDGCGPCCCGKGAWEIAARYARLDLDDQEFGSERGILEQYTIGVNWYWNPNMKVQANFEWFKLEDTNNTPGTLVNGDVRQFLMAFNWDF